MNHHEAFIQGRDGFGRKGIGRIHRGDALEVEMGARKLRGDKVDVVLHRADHRVHHRLPRVAAFAGVADKLLDPLKIDDGHHADQKVDMVCDVVLRRHDAAVQAFVKEDVSRLGQRLPGREGPRNLVPRHGFVIGM